MMACGQTMYGSHVVSSSALRRRIVAGSGKLAHILLHIHAKGCVRTSSTGSAMLALLSSTSYRSPCMAYPQAGTERIDMP